MSDAVALDIPIAFDLPVAVAFDLPLAVAFGLADTVAIRMPLTFVRPFSLGEPEPGCLTDPGRTRSAR